MIPDLSELSASDIAALMTEIRRLPAQQQEEYLALLKEVQIRAERRRQQDEKYGLINFVRYFWKVLEPNREFQEGWALEAMCLHLQAVSYGYIRRLLINISPGACKSLLTNVFFPAWEWGPMGRPDLRYIGFSYSSHLTERDNQKFLDLISSPQYQEMWGGDFCLKEKGKIKTSNDKTGWKFASSVRGVGTGERADRICFPADEIVWTEMGPLPIGEVVSRRMKVRAWSVNPNTGKPSLQFITGWHKNPASCLLRVTLEDGSSVRCTPDHRLLTRRGWIEAASLIPFQMRPSAFLPNGCDGAGANVEFFGKEGGATTGFENVSNILFRKLGSHMSGSFPYVGLLTKSICCPSPSGASAYVSNGSNMDAVSNRKLWGCFVTGDNFSGDKSSDLCSIIFPWIERSVGFCVRDVLCSSTIFEVIKAIVERISVKVADISFFRTLAYEGSHYQPVDEYIYRLTVIPREGDTVISAPNGWNKNSAFDFKGMFGGSVSVPVNVLRFGRFSDDFSRKAADPSEIGDSVMVLKSISGKPYFARVVAVEFDGHVEDTYCLTIEETHTAVVGGCQVICHNCLDDPHSIKDQESKIIREETVRWFHEAMRNRLNDDQSAIVIIMQRVHEHDVSGSILDKELDYEHLMIQCEYDPGVHCRTSIGWEDPRTEEGECFWPSRYPPHIIEEAKSLGEYAWSSQYQQIPSPRGGGIFKREWWNMWEPEDGNYPIMHYVLASLDGAFTEKEDNDPSALVVLGVNNSDIGPRIFLIEAWSKRLPIHAAPIPRLPGETDREYHERSKAHYGLVEKVVDTCKRRKVDKLLIEGKGPGWSVAQEISRLMFKSDFGVELIDPGRIDKQARALRVQHIASAGLLYRPNRKWADAVENEMANFPKAAHDDLFDAMVQGLTFLRANGLIERVEEKEFRELYESSYEAQRPRGALYPV